ncbi:MAG: transketolase [bacterium]
MISTSSLIEICKQIRRDIIESTYAAGSGHPTTCLSAVELVATLFFKYLVFEPQNYPQIYHDEFILSKGHAAPLLYSIYKKVGIIYHDLLSLRKLGSPLEGHPSVKLPGINYATGSLGQGLAIAVGSAWARKYHNVNSKVYVLVGDGEFAEGSNYEALNLATKYNLNNLCLIIDVNRLGQSEPTLFGHDLLQYSKRLEAFGWEYQIIDGHDIQEIEKAYQKFKQGTQKPFAIVAKTYKGKGISFLEDKENWHGKPIQDPQDLQKAIQELGVDINQEMQIKPSYSKYPYSNGLSTIEEIEIDIDPKPMATRQALPKALTQIAKKISNIVVLDADVKNSTYTEYFQKEFPERFIQCHIAEQAMVGAALGLAKNKFIVYLSTFGAFLTRAFDFIRMMVYSQPPLVIFVGTHAGISIGEDGPSQMALEDIAMFNSLIKSTVLYPSDSISAQKMLQKVIKEHLKGNLEGIVYFRASRPSTPNIYQPNEEFEIGKVKVIKQHPEDKVAVISAGVIIHQVLKAYELLEKENINIRVIDALTIKPIDQKHFIESLGNVKKILVFEEHSEYGGIGQVIASILLKNKYNVDYFDNIGVNSIPGSASPQELMNQHGLDYLSIYNKVKEII